MIEILDGILEHGQSGVVNLAATGGPDGSSSRGTIPNDRNTHEAHPADVMALSVKRSMIALLFATVMSRGTKSASGFTISRQRSFCSLEETSMKLP
jgi:hypothetical protein